MICKLADSSQHGSACVVLLHFRYPFAMLVALNDTILYVSILNYLASCELSLCPPRNCSPLSFARRSQSPVLTASLALDTASTCGGVTVVNDVDGFLNEMPSRSLELDGKGKSRSLVRLGTCLMRWGGLDPIRIGWRDRVSHASYP